jgi:hypothetical protein
MDILFFIEFPGGLQLEVSKSQVVSVLGDGIASAEMVFVQTENDFAPIRLDDIDEDSRDEVIRFLGCPNPYCNEIRVGSRLEDL